MIQQLREHTLTIDYSGGRVLVSPPATYDVTDPGDDFPTPSWWRSRVIVDGSVVRLKTKACHFVFTCGLGYDNFTLEAGTEGVTSVSDVGVADDQDPDYRIGQSIAVTPTLPSTNGREYAFELVSYTGDARSLRVVPSGFAAPFGANNIPFALQRTSDSVLVAPAVGATYTVDVLFWQTS